MTAEIDTSGSQSKQGRKDDMTRLKLYAGAAALALLLGGSADAAQLNIAFTVHSATSNTFWQAVKKGFDDACAKIQANCQMIFTQTEGSIAEQSANMQTAIAANPDALITSIVDNNAFTSLLQDARSKGILVIASNVDATEGPAKKIRQAFIGQGFIPAGYSLGQAQSRNFPKDGPIHVLVGVSAPGQNWSEQRAKGVMNFMEDFKKANPGRDITVERIDSGTDLAVVSDRVGAYLNAHPDTTAYFDTGFWHAGVARVLADRGVKPGKVLLGGFDLVPEVLEQMKAGYVQVQIDQQPYEQGFMPVMEAYLAKTVGLAPADIDTGQGVVTPDQVDAIMALSKQGVR
jgi:simple sugar transport system substrate-binding protein